MKSLIADVVTVDPADNLLSLSEIDTRKLRENTVVYVKGEKFPGDGGGGHYVWRGSTWEKYLLGDYLWMSRPQELTPAHKEQLAQNWPEAALFPQFDFIVVDGDSRSQGAGVGSWPTDLQSIKPFDKTTITSVAESGHQSWQRLAAFDTDVLPLAPSGSQRALYILYVGVNDLFQIGGANYSHTYDIYKTIRELWVKAKAAGFEVCAVTLQDADHTSALEGGVGIPYREERQELLNRLILAGNEFYDFLIPLHQLIPDYTVYAVDSLHLNSAGNQFIAEQAAKILGATDRTKNVAALGQGLSNFEFNTLPASLNYGRSIWPFYNLAMATETVANSGSISNVLGFKRLTSAASTSSQAAIRMAWHLLNSGNQINWANSDRYRGLVIDFDRISLTEGHVFRTTIGNNGTAFDKSGFGFEFRNNAGTYQIRIVANDESLVSTTSDWETVGAESNFQIVFFAKGTDITLLHTRSNGSIIPEVWFEMTSTGAPDASGNAGGNVCITVEATASPPSSSSAFDIRSVRAFESFNLPLSSTKFNYR